MSNALLEGIAANAVFRTAGNDTHSGGDGIDSANYSSLGRVVILGSISIPNKVASGIDALVGIETIIHSSLLGDTIDHSGASLDRATGQGHPKVCPVARGGAGLSPGAAAQRGPGKRADPSGCAPHHPVVIRWCLTQGADVLLTVKSNQKTLYRLG